MPTATTTSSSPIVRTSGGAFTVTADGTATGEPTLTLHLQTRLSRGGPDGTATLLLAHHTDRIVSLIGGDCWQQWCEQAYTDGDTALHVDVHLAGLNDEQRLDLLSAMLNLSGAQDHALTSPHNWSQQVPSDWQQQQP